MKQVLIIALTMKRLLTAMPALVFLMGNSSCKKNPDQQTNLDFDLTAPKTNVQTFEIVNLITHKSLNTKYSGTFGSKPIEIIKTSDTTLAFYIPDVAQGESLLNFELGAIKFNVAKTAEIAPTQVITTLTQDFDTKISLLNPSAPGEIAEIDSSKKFKQDVVALFNSLNEQQKREAILFYEANKSIFKSFTSSTFTNLDTTTVMARRQSDCPRIDFKTFYGCTAENLANSAIELKNSSIEFLKMMGMAGVMAGTAYNTSVLGPVAWGITAVGISLPLGTAGYLLLTEVRPAVTKFKHSLYPFLEANWIFSKALFQATTEVFQDQISTSLNLLPKFRSITSSDGDINTGSGIFISAMSSLSGYWYRLTAIFGSFPEYRNTEQATTLASNEVSVSNISNPNVQYLGNTGQSVKFKTTTGKEQTFTYTVAVDKQGFREEKVLTGKVLAVTDSIPIYTASALGSYTVTGPPALGNGPNTRLYCELKAGGIAVYKIYDDPSWPNGYSWAMSWTVRKFNNRYYILTAWTNPPYIQAEAQPLTYPVTSFVYRHTYTR